MPPGGRRPKREARGLSPKTGENRGNRSHREDGMLGRLCVLAIQNLGREAPSGGCPDRRGTDIVAVPQGGPGMQHPHITIVVIS